MAEIRVWTDEKPITGVLIEESIIDRTAGTYTITSSTTGATRTQPLPPGSTFTAPFGLPTPSPGLQAVLWEEQYGAEAERI